MVMSSPVTIRLFLIDGKATGPRIAEISNWSGKMLAGPRSELLNLRQRQELAAPGIYILVGKDAETEDTVIYIGEAENVAKRLTSRKHSEADFWTTVIAAVSKDENLTKSHIKFLEGKLIEKAKHLGLNLANSQGSGSSLPESDQADMVYFLKKIYQLLPVLGLREFEEAPQVSKESGVWLSCVIRDLKASGRRTPNGFLVAKGSEAVLDVRKSAKRMPARRQKLIDKGVMQLMNDRYVFNRDWEFSSPSAAAAMVVGGAANGLMLWRNKLGEPLKLIEATSVQ